MKKLIVAAGAVAMAWGAFAVPEVYDYKASLKNMYLKEVNVTIGSGQSKQSFVVYMKYQRGTTLNGYLIMDQDGVTSPTLWTPYMDTDKKLVYKHSPSRGYDYGRNRGFLVVINRGAYAAVRHPKILPAILDGKWIDTAFTKGHKALSGPAEGYLYVGGDAVMPVRPQLDDFGGVSVERDYIPYVPYTDGTPTNYTGMVAIADYVWTSVYLFADNNKKTAFVNGPNWFKAGVYSPFGGFEYAWDQNLPELLQTGWVAVTETIDPDDDPGSGDEEEKFVGAYKDPVNYFHDTWMNGSGVGKWTTKNNKDAGEYCCGIVDEGYDYNDLPKLDTLSGGVKGGLFLCTENGIDAKAKEYTWFDDVAWEDQFNTARIEYTDTAESLFAPDAWQNDLWQDGFLEVETTDVIYGTWSIKRVTEKFFAKKNPIYFELDAKALRTITSYGAEKIPSSYTVKDSSGQQGSTEEKTYSGGVATIDPILWGTIYGAAYKLMPTANVIDGTEIYAKSIANRANLPMITPQFALYYRLIYGDGYKEESDEPTP